MSDIYLLFENYTSSCKHYMDESIIANEKRGVVIILFYNFPWKLQVMPAIVKTKKVSVQSSRL